MRSLLVRLSLLSEGPELREKDLVAGFEGRMRELLLFMEGVRDIRAVAGDLVGGFWEGDHIWNYVADLDSVHIVGGPEVAESVEEKVASMENVEVRLLDEEQDLQFVIGDRDRLWVKTGRPGDELMFDYSDGGQDISLRYFEGLFLKTWLRGEPLE